MTINEATENGFMENLDANPYDSMIRLIYADWLEDFDRNDEAYIQRWLAEKGLAPRKSPPNTGENYKGEITWDWWNSDIPYQEHLRDVNKALLPADIFDELESYIGPEKSWIDAWKEYKSRIDAEIALGLVLLRRKNHV